MYYMYNVSTAGSIHNWRISDTFYAISMWFAEEAMNSYWIAFVYKKEDCGCPRYPCNFSSQSEEFPDDKFWRVP